MDISLLDNNNDPSVALENAKLLANFANFSRLLTSVDPTIAIAVNGSSSSISTLLPNPQFQEVEFKLEHKEEEEDVLESDSSPKFAVSISPTLNESVLKASPGAVSLVVTPGKKSGRGCKGQKTEHTCPHCNFTTFMSQHMKSHLEAHERHQGQMYQCDICQMQFSQKANMHRHRMRHTGVKPYECRFCHKNFFRKDQMQEHSMTHIKTGEDFDCPVAQCAKQFHQHSALRQHLDDEHVITSHQQACCKRCALLFSNSRRLLLHFQTKHDDLAGVELSPSSTQKRPSSHDSSHDSSHSSAEEISLHSPLSPEQSDIVGDALKMCTERLEAKTPTQPPAKRRRASAKKSTSGDGKAQSSYNMDSLLKAGGKQSPIQCLLKQEDKKDESSAEANNIGMISSVIKSSSNQSLGDMSAFSMTVQNFLPRSKSPDYKNLIFNNYTSYDLLARLSAAQNDFAANKMHHHMKLWTNAANSLSSITSNNTSSENASNGHEEEHPTCHHSSTHSPSAFSSSTTTSTSSNHSEQQVGSSSTSSGGGSNEAGEDMPLDYCTSRGGANANANLNGSGSGSTSTSNGNPFGLSLNGLGMVVENGGLKEPLECLHCGILFMDQTLHLIHKGLHSDSDIWRCNLCGTLCNDKYTFTTHMISSDHS